MQMIDPHSYADLSQGRIQHIDFDIWVDFRRRQLKIRAHYELDRPVSGCFFLDSREVRIKQISAGPRTIGFELGEPDPLLGQKLTLKDLDHVHGFTVELTTAPEASALQWLEPKQTTSKLYPFLYSQCFALHARSIFPCQDTPSVRFTYDARLRVPGNLMAAMAAAPVQAVDEVETRVFSFRMPQPIPSYLFAFAVGELQFKELGPRTGIYAEPQVLEQAAWEFAENEQKIDEAERLFGPYLWDRYDLLIMPPSFPYGGMENPRLTFISPLAILGTREQARLISHELAHAWTGNLVTNATWEDFWLNEGWTTYAEYRISEVVDGIERRNLYDHDARIDLREQLELFHDQPQLTCLKVPMQGVDPDQVISGIPYTKGRLFLESLETAVGRPRFDRFIQKYIERFRFQSLSTEGFREFLEKELPQAAEQIDLEEWLNQPGLPAGVPESRSALFNQVQDVLAAYASGILPAERDVRGWHYLQKAIFFSSLPKVIPAEHCRYFENLFRLQAGRPAAHTMEFYRVCMRSGDRESWPAIEAFVAQVGRNYLLKPLFRTMLEAEWTRSLARPLFERVRGCYHPITVTVIEGLFRNAGL